MSSSTLRPAPGLAKLAAVRERLAGGVRLRLPHLARAGWSPAAPPSRCSRAARCPWPWPWRGCGPTATHVAIRKIAVSRPRTTMHAPERTAESLARALGAEVVRRRRPLGADLIVVGSQAAGQPGRIALSGASPGPAGLRPQLGDVVLPRARRSSSRALSRPGRSVRAGRARTARPRFFAACGIRLSLCPEAPSVCWTRGHGGRDPDRQTRSVEMGPAGGPPPHFEAAIRSFPSPRTRRSNSHVAAIPNVA